MGCEEEVGSQLQVLSVPGGGSQEGPVVPGEARVHAHLSSHVSRGRNSPQRVPWLVPDGFGWSQL